MCLLLCLACRVSAIMKRCKDGNGKHAFLALLVATSVPNGKHGAERLS